MPQALQTLVVAIGGTNTNFVLAQRGQNAPTVWTRSLSASGALIGNETVSHVLKNTPAKQVHTLECRLPTVVDETVGSQIVPSVARTNSGYTKLDFSKLSTTAERTRAVDAQIGLLTALRAGIIAGETYF